MNAASAAGRKKRLGQFFSGMKVGRLLASLAEAERAQHIIDPMAGSGDLLQACLDVGARPQLLAGIEIDIAAYDLARGRVSSAQLVRADAFDPGTRSRLTSCEFDLVIGNPPFVRYQASSPDSAATVLNARHARTGLLHWLQELPHLSPAARHTLTTVAHSYSGLADLAAPASLLAMALVGPGGRLALVLPQPWLTREYSRPVRAALHQLFDLEYVVEDEHAAWFDDAVVKTTLVVARRVERGARAPEGNFTRVKLAASADVHGSLVGVVPGEDASFAARLRSGDDFCDLSAQIKVDRLPREGEAESVGYLHQLCGRGTNRQPSPSARLPVELSQLIGTDVAASLIRLDASGFEVGQGLRTGANPFFYVAKDSPGLVRTSHLLGGDRLPFDRDLLRAAVRDQRELDGLVVEDSTARSFIVDLRAAALQEDLEAAHPDSREDYRSVPAPWADVVRRAAGLSLRPGGPTIPNLTAVAPNARLKDGQPARFWYMLPDFQPRHAPDVFMARVVGGRTTAYRNLQRSCLVDANFVTFRAEAPRADALYAVLNSDWVFANLELTSAVLGGGALKIEAATCRLIGLPRFSAAAWHKLGQLGRHLTSAGGMLTDQFRRDVDRVILEAIVPSDRVEHLLDRVRVIAHAHREARQLQRPAARAA